MPILHFHYCNDLKVWFSHYTGHYPDWKVCFLRQEDIFHSKICVLGKTALASPPHMKWDIFQEYFSNSARFIGRCAHGSVLARGRSSARTTYFLGHSIQISE